MASTRVLLGNLYARGTTTLAAGTSAAAYPLANLYDGRPGKPWRGGAAAASFLFQVDGNLALNGDMEAAFVSGAPPGWTASNTGTGAATRDTTHNSGTYGCKLTAGTGTSSIYYDLTARPGEKITVTVAFKGDGTGTMRAKLRNLTTGFHLTSGSSWQRNSTDFATRSASTWATTTLSPTVEVYSTVLSDTCTLRLTIHLDDATQVGYADDVYLWPWVDFASIHGHNLGQATTVQLDSSDDASSWTTEATLTLAQPAFYSLLSAAVGHRYYRLNLSDLVALTVPVVGEAVIGQTIALSRTPRHPESAPWDEGLSYPQVRAVTPAGAQFVASRTSRSVRRRAFEFIARDQATVDELVEVIWRRTSGGATPGVLIPYDSEPVALFGRPLAVSQPRRVSDLSWSTIVDWSEEPGPVVAL